MKRYKIKYTQNMGGYADEESMTFCGLDMLDSLAYIRHLAAVLNFKNFRILNVYAETDDGTAWDPVPDWADTEYSYQMYLAEKSRKGGRVNAGSQTGPAVGPVP